MINYEVFTSKWGSVGKTCSTVTQQKASSSTLERILERHFNRKTTRKEQLNGSSGSSGSRKLHEFGFVEILLLQRIASPNIYFHLSLSLSSFFIFKCGPACWCVSSKNEEKSSTATAEITGGWARSPYGRNSVDKNIYTSICIDRIRCGFFWLSDSLMDFTFSGFYLRNGLRPSLSRCYSLDLWSVVIRKCWKVYSKRNCEKYIERERKRSATKLSQPFMQLLQ